MNTPRIDSGPKVIVPSTRDTRYEPADANADGSDAPDEAVRACVARHGAAGTYGQFQQVLATVFPRETQFTLSLESDPDEAEDTVVCVAALPPAQSLPALAYYNQFVAQWARQADPRTSGLFTLLVRKAGPTARC